MFSASCCLNCIILSPVGFLTYTTCWVQQQRIHFFFFQSLLCRSFYVTVMQTGPSDGVVEVEMGFWKEASKPGQRTRALCSRTIFLICFQHDFSMFSLTLVVYHLSWHLYTPFFSELLQFGVFSISVLFQSFFICSLVRSLKFPSLASLQHPSVRGGLLG